MMVQFKFMILEARLRRLFINQLSEPRSILTPFGKLDGIPIPPRTTTSIPSVPMVELLTGFS